MNFNKQEFDMFRKDVLEALADVGKKYGLVLSTGNIKYDEFDFTMQLKATKLSPEVDGQKVLFERYCELYGFKKEDYLREFKDGTRVYRLTGFNLNAKKNSCILYCISNEATYSAAPMFVRDCFQRQETMAKM